MADYLVFLLFRGLVLLFRLFPFRLIYIFSDFFFFMGYTLLGYRKKVVFGNLRRSFPARNEKEIKAIATRFYHHLFDLLVESLKSFSMSETSITKRFRVAPSPYLEEQYRRGRNVIVVSGHYNNWEWAGVAAGSQVIHRPVGFYKPLSNRFLDNYMLRSRGAGRVKLVSISRTAEVFRTDYGEPAILYMIADQSPSSPRLAYWVEFLGQDTAVLHGPEKYARVNNLPVVYAKTVKVKRGFYKVDFILIEDDPVATKTGEITAKFMKLLEESILEAPEYYLWSHRRWKLKREKKGA